MAAPSASKCYKSFICLRLHNIAGRRSQLNPLYSPMCTEGEQYLDLMRVQHDLEREVGGVRARARQFPADRSIQLRAGSRVEHDQPADLRGVVAFGVEIRGFAAQADAAGAHA